MGVSAVDLHRSSNSAPGSPVSAVRLVSFPSLGKADRSRPVMTYGAAVLGDSRHRKLM